MAVLIAPGYRFINAAAAGKPEKVTEPVAKAHDGCTTASITGAVGVTGCAGIRALPDEGEVHPRELVTVKVYVVAAVRPGKVPVAPVPVIVAPPGIAVTVQVPEPGKPLKATLPVARVHVGAVIVPIIGAVGLDGCAGIAAFNEDGEVHPRSLVTLKVYVVDAVRPEMLVVGPLPV